jgi:putative acetyltransferase
MKAINRIEMKDFSVEIREIEFQDNERIAKILRETLLEHGAAKPGTAYFDESTDHLFEHFQKPNCGYFVATVNEEVVGGVGIYPTEGLPSGICELVKMYIDKEFRGFGIGKLLLTEAVNFAKSINYSAIYLESMPELDKAVSIYTHMGFKSLIAPLGNTGHFSCPIWMLMEI